MGLVAQRCCGLCPVGCTELVAATSARLKNKTECCGRTEYMVLWQLPPLVHSSSVDLYLWVQSSSPDSITWVGEGRGSWYSSLCPYFSGTVQFTVLRVLSNIWAFETAWKPFASLLHKFGILFLLLSVTALPSLVSKQALKLTSSNSILNSDSFFAAQILSSLIESFPLYHSSSSPAFKLVFKTYLFFLLSLMSCMSVCMLFTGIVHACDPMSVYVTVYVYTLSCMYIYFTIFISFKPESEICQPAVTNRNPA